MGLLQIHHHFENGTTKMCSQREIDGSQDSITKFLEDTKASHPLPDGAQWIAVPESSPRFVVTVEKEEVLMA